MPILLEHPRFQYCFLVLSPPARRRIGEGAPTPFACKDCPAAILQAHHIMQWKLLRMCLIDECGPCMRLPQFRLAPIDIEYFPCLHTRCSLERCSYRICGVNDSRPMSRWKRPLKYNIPYCQLCYCCAMTCNYTNAEG